MKRTKSPVLLFFVLFAILAHCKTTATQTKEFTVQEIFFYLQPYQNTQVFLNGKKVEPKILEKNKSLALLSLILKEPAPHKFHFENALFAKLTYSLTERDYLKIQKQEPLFFQLLPEKTPLRLYSRFSTCHKPKSARFLSNEKILVTCLEDNKSEIIDILQEKKYSLILPEKIAQAQGFVESLSIPERNVFYISQMTTHSIHAFSLKDYQYLKTIPTSGKWSKVLLWDKYRRKIYVSNWLSKDISVIDMEQEKEVQRFSLPGVPRGMALSTDGQELIVALFGSQNDTDGIGGVVGLNVDTGKVNFHIKNLGTMRHIVQGGEFGFYLSDMSRNQICELKKQKLSCIAKTFAKPNTIVYDESRNWIFVSTRGPNNPKSYLLPGLEFGRIAIYQLPELSLLYEWEAGEQPTGLDLSPNKRFLATTDFLQDGLRVYEILDTKAL